MLLTLGCYGFVYTNAIARGFAPAQMLTLCGVALLFGRRPLLAGACLGAACCCNYLAVFVAAAVVIAAGAWLAVPAAIPFLAVDAWFFAAQHAAGPASSRRSRSGPSLLRLAEYQTAAVFGGLPLYVDGVGRIAVGAIVGLVSIGLVLCVARARPLHAGPAIRLVLAASVATPIGLLLLGAVFNNTPIELRYLSFGLPFIALLVAWSLRRCHGRASLAAPSSSPSSSPASPACCSPPAPCNPPAPPQSRPPASPATGSSCSPAATTASASSAPSGSRPPLPCRSCCFAPPTRSPTVSPHTVAWSSPCCPRTATAPPRSCSRAPPSPPELAPRRDRVQCRGLRTNRRGRVGDVLRGLHPGPRASARRNDPAASWRLRPAAAAAARQPADPRDVAPRRARTGETFHRDLPRPARLRLLAETARHAGPCPLRQDRDGEGHDRRDGSFRVPSNSSSPATTAAPVCRTASRWTIRTAC